MIETVMKSKMSLRRNLTIAFSLAIALGSVCLTLATRYVFRHVLAEAGLPEGALEHLGGHVAHILAGLAILGALFALFAADVLSKAVIRPVRRLVQAVEQIDCEDLNMAIAAPAGDEFERLGEAFNGMVARLRQSREELETRVQQRTAELSSANAALLFEISHRKESEKRLAYLASFPERDPCPVMEVDWNGHVRYANPAARSLFADIYDRQDAHPWLADWAAVVRMLQEQNAATASRDVVLEGRSYQQLFHHFAQDQFVRIYGLDVTDRKEAERQQAQLLKKLSETNQQLQDFAYVVSHDLKAPLRGIRTIVDWLNADYADQLDEQGREHLSLLVGRAGRMQSLIDGVLQYSRIGHAEQNAEPVDLGRLLPEIIDSLDVPDRISIHIETDLPTVEADVTRITQVFQNLLSNAIKYMDKPQGRIALACVEDDGFWRFSVADNGPGIEEKHFDRVFKLFQTLTTGNEAESTGIGLALVKRIVEIYGGRVWVESEVGRGSTFLFTFPQCRETVAPERSTPRAVCSSMS